MRNLTAGEPRSIAFVGPLPPPVHGFANICAMMLDRLIATAAVKIFDRAPKAAPPLGILQQLYRPLEYLALGIRRRNTTLYLALSGGYGQLYDLMYVLICKLLGQRVFVHHHSFAYINSPSRLNKIFFSLVRRDTHIVLSRNMGTALVRLYGVDVHSVKVISNAAFYDATLGEPEAARDDSDPICIGFLSNITFEKGFVEFFEVLRELKRRGVAYRALIGGPVAPSALPKFTELMKQASGVEYRGPIYGAEKERFYRQLDIFLFPTSYANEAEPLVIYEAMRQGVFVIACDRGAIPEMLRNGAGLAFSRTNIVESATMHIEKFSGDRRELASACGLSLRQAQRIRSSSRAELEDVLACM